MGMWVVVMVVVVMMVPIPVMVVMMMPPLRQSTRPRAEILAMDAVRHVRAGRACALSLDVVMVALLRRPDLRLEA